MRIYKTFPEGSVLALRMVLDEATGTVQMKTGDAHTEEARRLLDSLLLFDPGPPPRALTPTDGMDYLKAVHRALMRSSAWHARMA